MKARWLVLLVRELSGGLYSISLYVDITSTKNYGISPTMPTVLGPYVS